MSITCFSNDFILRGPLPSGLLPKKFTYSWRNSSRELGNICWYIFYYWAPHWKPQKTKLMKTFIGWVLAQNSFCFLPSLHVGSKWSYLRRLFPLFSVGSGQQKEAKLAMKNKWNCFGDALQIAPPKIRRSLLTHTHTNTQRSIWVWLVAFINCHLLCETPI